MRCVSARDLRLWVVACGFLSGIPVLAARGQTESTDAALHDRVLQLVDRLDAPKAEAREAAMASLVKLGPKILPMLPDVATLPAGNRKEQIEKLRAALRRPRTTSIPMRAG